MFMRGKKKEIIRLCKNSLKDQKLSSWKLKL